MYASYTHFRVKSWWALPLFQWHAFRSGSQAYRTKGLLQMKTFSRGARNFCTLTCWNTRAEMMAFRNSGAHLLAMKLSRKMGEGYTTGWETDRMPSAEEGETRLKNKLELSGQLEWLLKRKQT